MFTRGLAVGFIDAGDAERVNHPPLAISAAGQSAGSLWATGTATRSGRPLMGRPDRLISAPGG